MATVARSALRAGCKSVLDTYRTANPTKLIHTYDHTPGSPRLTAGYVDNSIGEQLSFSMGVRQRVLVARVVVLTRLVSNAQSADEQDDLVDGLIDAFTTASRTAVAGCVILPASVDPVEVQLGDAIYAGSVINVRADVQEGRTV